MKLFNKVTILAIVIIFLLSLSSTPSIVSSDPTNTVFGETGAGNGQFESPRGVNIIDDTIYVADFDNDRVQMFDMDGNYLNQFGNEGVLDGQLNGPEGLTYYDSKIYVPEFTNNRVSIFHPNGTFIEKFGVSGASTGEMLQIFEVAINDDWLYLSNRGNTEITAYNASDFTYLGSIGKFAADTSYKRLQQPHGIAIDDTYLFIADTLNNSVKVFLQQSDTYLYHFGDNPGTASNLRSPFDVDVLGDIVAVSDLDGIKFYDKQGNYITGYIDQINTPKFIDLTNKQMVVSDDFTNQIYLLDLIGDPVDIRATSGQTSITVTWDSNNDDGLLDAETYKVFRNGEFLAETSEHFFIDATAIHEVSYTYSVQALGIAGESDIIDTPSSITLEGIVTETTTTTSTETVTDSSDSFSVPLNIIPMMAMILIIPVLRKKYKI